MPTILNLMKAGESMIVTDPKAELYERTSGIRRVSGTKNPRRLITVSETVSTIYET